MTVDAAVATGSLRTLGTGAQQAAPGNHTHTLATDLDDNAIRAYAGDLSPTRSISKVGVNHGDTADLTSITKTYASLSRCVAMGFSWCYIQMSFTTLKLRLIMDGVQVAESGFLKYEGQEYIVQGQKALSGSKTCILRIANVHASQDDTLNILDHVTADRAAAVIAVGSVKL